MARLRAERGNLTEAGCTDAEVAAILVHRTRRMVAEYTADADRQRAAASAMRKMRRRWTAAKPPTLSSEGSGSV